VQFVAGSHLLSRNTILLGRTTLKHQLQGRTVVKTEQHFSEWHIQQGLETSSEDVR
jgi:hypothetical protein